LCYHSAADDTNLRFFIHCAALNPNVQASLNYLYSHFGTKSLAR
jgi:hypothetical protein